MLHPRGLPATDGQTSSMLLLFCCGPGRAAYQETFTPESCLKAPPMGKLGATQVRGPWLRGGRRKEPVSGFHIILKLGTSVCQSPHSHINTLHHSDSCPCPEHWLLNMCVQLYRALGEEIRGPEKESVATVCPVCRCVCVCLCLSACPSLSIYICTSMSPSLSQVC